jgi:phage gp36-like protein
MAYSTESDILNRIEEATLVQLTDRTGSGQVDSALVGSAIEDADALINGIISTVYQVPIANVPRVVRELSATIAVYRLHLYRSADSGVWKDAYKGAMGFLGLVATRKATLEGVVAKPGTAGSQSDSTLFSSEERKFSRSKLSEW